jgi:hypothetical protein
MKSTEIGSGLSLISMVSSTFGSKSVPRLPSSYMMSFSLV